MTRGLWTQETLGWLVAFALLPVAAVLVALDGHVAVGRLLAALVGGVFWQAVFRSTMGVPFSPTGAVTAVAVALLAPEGLEAWKLAAGAGFGVIIAELVFGGWGRNVIGAPSVALAFLFLSYPAAPLPEPQTAVALAAAVSGLILLATGILSARVAVSAAAACLAGAYLLGLEPGAVATSGALVFGTVFLVGDPVAAAATRTGRWLYGGLAGGLAVLLAAYGPGPAAPQPIVFAALLAQVFAPLLDHAAISAALFARSRRHG